MSQIHWQLETRCIIALSYCLSREIAHFVFADIAVTVSLHAMTGWSREHCELCYVRMIGGIDLVFGSRERDMLQTLADYCCQQESISLTFVIEVFTKLLLEEKRHER